MINIVGLWVHYSIFSHIALPFKTKNRARATVTETKTIWKYYKKSYTRPGIIIITLLPRTKRTQYSAKLLSPIRRFEF